MAEITRKYLIEETSQFMRETEGFKYNVSVWISVDGGENFAYCGIGRFTKTIEDATAYINEYNKRNS